MNRREYAGSRGDSEVAQLRVPPMSIESESCVLSGLLLDNSVWDRVGDLLTDSDFYRLEHKLVYAAICQLITAMKPADVFTVYEHLQRSGKDEGAGGLPYITSLAQYVPSGANIRRYAEIVRERAILRQLITASDEIATEAFNPDGRTVAQILDGAQQRIVGIGEKESSSREEWHDINSGMMAVLDRIQELAGGEKPDFLPTGLKALDARLDGGMRGGDLIVIGGRPSMGKSALGMSIAAHVALREGVPVAYFSLEMPARQLHMRLTSLVGKIHLSRIKRPNRLRDEDWPSITEAVELLRHCCFDINDQAGLTIGQLRAKARALKRRRGTLGLVVVDYLSLMVGTDQRLPRAQQLGEITMGLKNLAKELNVPILLLQQVNRKAEERTDGMPILSDLKDSGSIEQDADVVVLIHRPFKDMPDLSEDWRHYAKLSVAKVRDGEPGYVDVMYVGENTHFMDWPADKSIPTNKSRVARRPTATEL